MGFTVGAGRAVFWFCGASSSGFSKVGSTVGVLGAVFGTMGRAFPADSGVGSTEEASLGMPAPAFCGSKQDLGDSAVGSRAGSVDWACGARAQPKLCITAAHYLCPQVVAVSILKLRKALQCQYQRDRARTKGSRRTCEVPAMIPADGADIRKLI